MCFEGIQFFYYRSRNTKKQKKSTNNFYFFSILILNIYIMLSSFVNCKLFPNGKYVINALCSIYFSIMINHIDI